MASMSYLLRFQHLQESVISSNFSFFDSVDEYFEEGGESADGVIFALKIGLLFVANNDFSNLQTSKQMLIDLHLISRDFGALSLWGKDKNALMLSFALDSIKETLLKYLKHDVLGKDKEVVQRALQIFFNLGNSKQTLPEGHTW